jgi:hypothetical protein
MSSLIWVANYRDGSSISQINNDQLTSFDNIPRSGLWCVKLVDLNNKTILNHEFYPGQMPFYRRRVAMAPGEQPQIMHILGYREADNDNAFHCVFVDEKDAHIEVGSFRKEGEKRLRYNENRHSIELHPSDSIPIT